MVNKNSLTAAKQAKSEQHLAQLVRSTAFGITSRKERIDRALAGGAQLIAATVKDEARERAIDRELAQMRGPSGWGVPTGNECHPLTIRYRALQTEQAAGPTAVEYRLDYGEYWTVLTKTEWEYAKSAIALTEASVSPDRVS